MARLLLPLMLFALLLAPLRMLGMSEAAAASPAHGAHHAVAMESGHHGHSEHRDEAPAAPEADCMTACAAIAAPYEAGAPARFPAASPHYPVPAASASGLAPEAEPPPPRILTL